MLERVTVTIDEQLLSAVDELVGNNGVKSRSHAMDGLLRSALSQQRLRKALILAGGSETSLVAGKSIKPLAEVGGITVIERIILKLKRAGIGEVIISVGSLGEKLVAHLQDGSAYGVTIDYAWEDQPLGGAGALKNCQARLPEPFLLSYADVIYEELDLADLYRFHKSNNGVCTLALANSEEPSSFGVAKLSGSQIVEFEEKPSSAEGHLVNAGVAVCEPSIFAFIPKKLPASFEHDLLPSIAGKGKLYGYVYSGEWFDVGTPKSLKMAERHFPERHSSGKHASNASALRKKD